jgi:hypothetical protein
MAIISLYCLSCKKKSQYKIEYLELYNKPLNEIRNTLNGKWKVHKKQGGFAGLEEIPINTFYEFKFGGNISIDSVKNYNDTIVLANNKATWNNEYTNIWISANTYILRYTDNFIFSQSKIIYVIKNDTLEIRDNYPSGYSSFCTKVD